MFIQIFLLTAWVSSKGEDCPEARNLRCSEQPSSKGAYFLGVQQVRAVQELQQAQKGRQGQVQGSQEWKQEQVLQSESAEQKG
jgi:hypothetical protein